MLALAVVLTFLLGTASANAATAAPSPPSTVTTTTAVPVPKTTHPGVGRVLVISLPAISWEDLDLTALPHLSQVLATSTVADLSVRGVGRVPSLADGYVTIGAGTRSVGHVGDDGECLEPDEPFADGTAREEMARRNGVAVSAIPSTAILCLEQHQIVSRNNGLLFDAQVSALGDTLAAAGVQRAVIGNGDTTIVPTAGPDYRRWAALALTDRNGIVPDGAVGTSLLEKDPAAPFGLRLDPQKVLSVFDRVWNAPGRRGGRGGRQRSAPTPVVRLADQLECPCVDAATVAGAARRARREPHAAGDRSRRGASFSRRRSAAARAGSRSQPSTRPGYDRVSRSRAGPATRESSRSSTSGPTILDQLGYRGTDPDGGPPDHVRPHRRRLRVAPALVDRHQQGRAVPRP